MDNTERKRWVNRYMECGRNVSQRAHIVEANEAMDFINGNWIMVAPKSSNSETELSMYQGEATVSNPIRVTAVDVNDLGKFGTQWDRLILQPAKATYVALADLIIVRAYDETSTILGAIILHEAAHAHRIKSGKFDLSDESKIGTYLRRHLREEVLVYSTDHLIASAIGGTDYQYVLGVLTRAMIRDAQQKGRLVGSTYFHVSDYPPSLDQAFGIAPSPEAKIQRMSQAVIHGNFAAVDRTYADSAHAFELKLGLMGQLMEKTGIKS